MTQPMGSQASVPSTVLEGTPASPSLGSHDYAEVRIPKHVWTRNGNVV